MLRPYMPTCAKSSDDDDDDDELTREQNQWFVDSLIYYYYPIQSSKTFFFEHWHKGTNHSFSGHTGTWLVFCLHTNLWQRDRKRIPIKQKLTELTLYKTLPNPINLPSIRQLGYKLQTTLHQQQHLQLHCSTESHLQRKKRKTFLISHFVQVASDSTWKSDLFLLPEQRPIQKGHKPFHFILELVSQTVSYVTLQSIFLVCEWNSKVWPIK